MWYIMQAKEDSELIVGFNREMNKETYLQYLNNKNLQEILNYEPVKEGDVFFLPAGRVHSIGSGILLAEIQQTSDITYRIYDFDRRDDSGNFRELHTDLALDAIDYTHYNSYRTDYTVINNQSSPLISCPYFTTSILELSETISKDIALLDSFVIYMCLEGSGSIASKGNENELLKKGETLLIPASLFQYSIIPDQHMKLLEVYITS